MSGKKLIDVLNNTKCQKLEIENLIKNKTTVEFGTYGEKNLTWYILHKDVKDNKVLLLSQYALHRSGCKNFLDKGKNYFINCCEPCGSTDEECINWLNEHCVFNKLNVSKFEGKCSKLFFLNVSAVEKYLPVNDLYYLNNLHIRKCKFIGVPKCCCNNPVTDEFQNSDDNLFVTWRLSTKGLEGNDRIMCVYETGDVLKFGLKKDNSQIYLRPAMWVDLEKL